MPVHGYCQKRQYIDIVFYILVTQTVKKLLLFEESNIKIYRVKSDTCFPFAPVCITLHTWINLHIVALKQQRIQVTKKCTLIHVHTLSHVNGLLVLFIKSDFKSGL